MGTIYFIMTSGSHGYVFNKNINYQTAIGEHPMNKNNIEKYY